MDNYKSSPMIVHSPEEEKERLTVEYGPLIGSMIPGKTGQSLPVGTA